jgi:hypothetical protein
VADVYDIEKVDFPLRKTVTQTIFSQFRAHCRLGATITDSVVASILE